jgi:hypothetical protein
VVIDNPDLAALAILPNKTNPPLIVDADAVPALAVSLQHFQPVGRGNAQVIEPMRVVQHPQFSPRNLLNSDGKTARTHTTPYRFGFLVSEVEDHAEP